MADFTTTGLRVALYARVSTEEQRDGQTIDSQIAELERFAADRTLEITRIYKDDGWSGGVMARPELDHLRDDAQKGLFQAVLINDVDRLARDVTHLGVVKRDLERNGIRVIFRKLPAESSPTHNLMVNILGSFAEFERELIVDRTRRGRRHKVEARKKYLGGNTAYGYRYTPMNRAAGKEGFLEIIPSEASVVRQMFEWVDSEGLSARRVLNRLNDKKIPARKGARWAKSSVLRILRNEMYAGVWHYNKHEGCEPVHPIANRKYRKHVKSSVRARRREDWIPVQLSESLIIVPRDPWERVQRQITQNITFSPRNEKYTYLLKGLVRCAGCGSRYIGDPCHGKRYYRCIARCKKCPTIRESTLNDAVWEAVKAAVLNPTLIMEQVQALGETERVETEQAEDRKLHVEQELGSLRIEENRLLEAYRLSVISAAQLGQELEKLGVRKTALENERAGLNEVADHVAKEQIEKSVRDYCEESAKNLQTFSIEERQLFLRTLIQTITFTGTEARIRGEIPLQALPNTSAAPSGIPTRMISSDGGIATTMTGHSGLNSGRENVRQTKHPPLSFDLATDIVPDTRNADLARRLNLAKANAARLKSAVNSWSKKKNDEGTSTDSAEPRELGRAA
jgi:site-specific DNA recombinase